MPQANQSYSILTSTNARTGHQCKRDERGAVCLACCLADYNPDRCVINRLNFLRPAAFVLALKEANINSSQLFERATWLEKISLITQLLDI